MSFCWELIPSDNIPYSPPHTHTHNHTTFLKNFRKSFLKVPFMDVVPMTRRPVVRECGCRRCRCQWNQLWWWWWKIITQLKPIADATIKPSSPQCQCQGSNKSPKTNVTENGTFVTLKSQNDVVRINDNIIKCNSDGQLRMKHLATG